jgi:hypothetical protein
MEVLGCAYIVVSIHPAVQSQEMNIFGGLHTFKIKTESSQGKLEEVMRRGQQILLKAPKENRFWDDSPSSPGIPRRMRTAVECKEYELLNAVFCFGFLNVH